jgi:hypothetical protein
VGGDGGTVVRSQAILVGGTYRGGAPFADGAGDIAIVQLAQPISGVAPVAISRTAPQVGQQVYLIGFGASGSGWYGETISAGTKRWGVTRVDGVSQSLVYWRYDYGESNTAHGDSGGPQLLCTSVCQIVSVTSGGGDPNVYGSYSWNTRVDVYANAINQIISSRDETVAQPDIGTDIEQSETGTDISQSGPSDTQPDPNDDDSSNEPTQEKKKNKTKNKDKIKSKKQRRRDADVTAMVETTDTVLGAVRQKNAIDNGSSSKSKSEHDRGADDSKRKWVDASREVRFQPVEATVDAYDRLLETRTEGLLADAIASICMG